MSLLRWSLRLEYNGYTGWLSESLSPSLVPRSQPGPCRQMEGVGRREDPTGNGDGDRMQGLSDPHLTSPQVSDSAQKDPVTVTQHRVVRTASPTLETMPQRELVQVFIEQGRVARYVPKVQLRSTGKGKKGQRVSVPAALEPGC